MPRNRTAGDFVVVQFSMNTWRSGMDELDVKDICVPVDLDGNVEFQFLTRIWRSEKVEFDVKDIVFLSKKLTISSFFSF